MQIQLIGEVSNTIFSKIENKLENKSAQNSYLLDNLQIAKRKGINLYILQAFNFCDVYKYYLNVCLYRSLHLIAIHKMKCVLCRRIYFTVYRQ